MRFSECSTSDQIVFMKREFLAIVKNIFESPELLKKYVDDKQISNDQSKELLSVIDKFNSKNCICCRKFDQSKINLAPIQMELEPLLDIAKSNLNSRNY